MTNRLYWVDAKMHIIRSCDLMGGNKEVVFSTFSYLRHPFSITVFEDFLYWSDWETQAIHKVRKFKGGEQNVSTVVLGLRSPMDVHIYHDLRQPSATNRCEKTSCSHICLPSPYLSENSAHHICACPDDMILGTNGWECSQTDKSLSGPVLPPGKGKSGNIKATENPVTEPIPQNVGRIAGIVIGIIGALAIITAVVS